MGKNVVRESVNSTASIINNQINTATSNASTTINSSQIFNINNCNGDLFKNITFNAYQRININEQLNAFLSNTTDEQLSQEIQQVVNQLDGFLALGANEAQVLTNLVANLVNNMKNSFVNDCSSSSTITQGVLCQSSNNDIIEGITFNDYFTQVFDCIGSDQSVNSSKIDLEQFVKQNVKQTNLGLYGFLYWLGAMLGGIVLIIIIIAAIALLGGGAFLFYEGGLGVLSIILFVAAIILILLAIGYFPQWWPYETTTDLDTGDELKEKKRKNFILFLIFGISGLVALGAAIFLFFWNSGNSSKEQESKIKSEERKIQEKRLQAEIKNEGEPDLPAPQYTPDSLEAKMAAGANLPKEKEEEEEIEEEVEKAKEGRGMPDSFIDSDERLEGAAE